MTKYISNIPTKEKRKLFNYFEKNKKGGVLKINTVKNYIIENNLKIKYKQTGKTASTGYGKKSKIDFYSIKNKNKKIIGALGVKNKKSPRIVWWAID